MMGNFLKLDLSFVCYWEREGGGGMIVCVANRLMSAAVLDPI